MRYFLDRDGARYGPYALAEIRQYLASGNVAPTDRLVPEDGGTPISASELVEAGAAAEIPSSTGDSSPASPYAVHAGYAPVLQPLASPAYRSASSGRPMAAVIATQLPPPPNLDWWLVLLISVFTCSLFGYIWAIVQSRWVKKLDPGSRATLYLLLPLLLVPMIVAMAIGGGVVGGIAGRGGEMMGGLLMIPMMLLVAGAAIAAVAAFISMSSSLSAATTSWGAARIDLGGVFVAVTIVCWLANCLFLIAPVWIQYRFDRARQTVAWYGVPA